MAKHPETGLDRLLDVSLKVTVELGRTRVSIQELLRLTPGALVELDRLSGEPLDIRINGKLIARGEAVTINERLGIRITELIAAGSTGDAPPEPLDESA